MSADALEGRDSPGGPNETVAVFRQHAHAWHVWGHNWSASGSSPETMQDGCIGDVLDDTKAYERAVIAAPEYALRASDCLYGESSRLWNAKEARRR